MATPTQRFTVAGLLLLAALSAGLVWHRRTQATGGSGPAPGSGGRASPVSVRPAAKQDVPIVLEGLGSVVPLATVALKSRVDGRLDQVLFKEGQAVKKGDVLAQVDPRPFRIQVQQAQATLARDQAQLRNARLNLERYIGLRDQKLIPQQQVDDQRTLADQAVAAVGVDDALLANARLQLEWTQVTSPVDGVTGIRQVDAGNLIHASDANGLVTITQLEPIAVLFTLPQDDLPAISEALENGPLEVEALARDGTTRLGTGKLMMIDNQINPATSTLRLKAHFDNPHRTFWPNQFVKTRLRVRIEKNALTIPTPAVQRGPKGAFVYKVGDDSTAAMQQIEVERTQGELTVVRSGLEEGDRVVVDGQNLLRPGAKVEIRRGNGGGADTRP